MRRPPWSTPLEGMAPRRIDDERWRAPALAVVDELQWDRPVALLLHLAQQLNRRLQFVFTLASNTHRVALNLGLQLGQPISDEPGDLPRKVLIESLAQLCCLAHGP